MTIYDGLMLGLLVAGMVWGAWKGIIWQLASISSLVLGYAVAHQVSPQLAGSFPGEPVVARALAMMVIYAAVSGGVFLVAWLLRSTLRQLKFEAFDRHLGMIMGGLEGALLGLVGTLFVVSLDRNAREPIFSSPSGRIVSQVMDRIGPVLPQEVRQALAPYWDPASPGNAGTLAEGDADVPAPAPETRARTRNASTGSESQGPSTAAQLEHLVEEGETRLGRAIVETAEKGLQSQDPGHDRAAPQRR
jgi:membrane protein required for colicin V production